MNVLFYVNIDQVARNGKKYIFQKMWQILKRFSRALSWAQTSYFWRVYWSVIMLMYFIYIVKLYITTCMYFIVYFHNIAEWMGL